MVRSSTAGAHPPDDPRPYAPRDRTRFSGGFPQVPSRLATCCARHTTPRSRGSIASYPGLQGLELPAPAWEQHVLPARIERYETNDLEHLCLAGIVAWGRLRPGTTSSDESAQAIKLKRSRRLLSPGRNAPIAFLLREDLDAFLEPVAQRLDAIPTLSAMALEVAHYLEKHGASFLDDIARGTG